MCHNIEFMTNYNALAIGEGVISILETLWDGVKRTGKGLAFWDTREEIKIGGQNERAYEALKEIFKYGIADYNSPIEQTIRIILYHFYEFLPPAEKKKVVDAAIHKGLYLGSKAITSMGLSYIVSTRLTKKIVVSEVVKKFVRYAASAELTLLSMQGILYKKCHFHTVFTMKNCHILTLFVTKAFLLLLFKLRLSFGAILHLAD